MPESTSPINPLEEKFASFLKLNPFSKIHIDDNNILIDLPWNDTSFTLKFQESDHVLIETLNHSLLPERLTAIWHVNSKDLEIIYTPFLDNKDDEKARSFDFYFRNRPYKCEFAEPSNDLLSIASAFNQKDPYSSTNYRNLTGFKTYLRFKKEKPDAEILKETTPVSFWIRNVDWDENHVVELVNHLNFYMTYYDFKTPRILVHENTPLSSKKPTPPRYSFDAFPKQITGHVMEPYMLGLWESAVDVPDPFRRFLYNYQILEYAGFYYLQEGTLQSIRKIIRKPDSLERINEVVSQILDTVVEGRMEDDQRIVAVLKQLVRPEIIWKQIQPNIDYFSSPIEFEGGFSLSPLLKKGWQLDDFIASWIPAFPHMLRKIRNALVHSRESRMAQCIAPTKNNHNLLRPWLLPLQSAAMQVMIFRGI